MRKSGKDKQISGQDPKFHRKTHKLLKVRVVFPFPFCLVLCAEIIQLSLPLEVTIIRWPNLALIFTLYLPKWGRHPSEGISLSSIEISPSKFRNEVKGERNAFVI